MATQIKSFAMSHMTIGSCKEFHDNVLDLILAATAAELHIEALEPAYSQAVAQLAGIVNRQRAYISTARWPIRTRCATTLWAPSTAW